MKFASIMNTPDCTWLNNGSTISFAMLHCRALGVVVWRYLTETLFFSFSAVAHALQVGKDQTSAFQCGTRNCCVLFDRGDPNAGGQWRDTVICGRMIGRFVLVLVAACAAFAASDPSVNGPFASSRQTVDIPGL